MKKLLLVPALFFAACADVKPTNDNGVVIGTDVVDDGGGGSGGADNEQWASLEASFFYEPQACNDHTVLLHGFGDYTNGASSDNITCKFVFEDGSSADGCVVVHSIPSPQNVVLIVTDSVTGATARFEEVVSGPLSFEATLDVSSSGMTISWNADALYGGNPGAGTTLVSIEPAANVVVADPAVFQQRTGTVTVTAAGTYTVTVGASIQFGEVGGCFASVDKTVDIAAEPPPCPTTKHAD